ncbi:acireductone dioxygenase [Pseudomonas putida]|nr:acireductone dioxygenase [Pseudomonas putida]
MSRLTVYHCSTPDIPNKVLSHLEDIAATLGELGIGFERAEATLPVSFEMSAEAVMTTCQGEVDAWMAKGGYESVDVLSIDEDHGQHTSTQSQWLREHRVAGKWVLCVVAGRVQLSLHAGDYVYAVLCERDDRIAVPAGMAHWLDMGDRPRLVALRVLPDPDGWRPEYVEQPVHDRFPRFDD